MTRDPQSLAAGASAGGLQIERVLGTGAWGVTYLARDPAIDTRFALKEYLPADLVRRQPDGSLQAVDEAARKQFAAGLRQFLTEGRMIAALDHPNIVRLLRYFEANGTAYFLMPWQGDRTLYDLLKDGPLTDRYQARRLLLGMLDGLAYIHARGIFHQDIKPANILITDKGEPVLLDFGVAAAGPEGVPLAGQPLGSEGYAAPEQSEPDGEIGPWTDFYGLAATFYRALSGEIPVAAAQRAAALRDGKPDPLPRLSALLDASEFGSLVGVIEQGLELDPDLRPTDAAQWRKSFDSLDWRRTVTAQAAAGPEKPARPDWLPMALLAVILIGVVIGLAWLLTSTPENHQAETTPSVSTPAAETPQITAEERARWQAALKADTVLAYRRFLEDYPQTMFRDQAQIQLGILDDRLWEKLSAENNQPALEDYLKTFPNGRHQVEAMQKLDAMKQAQELADRQQAERRQLEQQAWQTARDAGTVAALGQYITDWPTGEHVGEARDLQKQLQDQTNELKAWQTALKLNTRDAMHRYMDAFPKGVHVTEALQAIDTLTLTPGKQFRDCEDCPAMVVLPAGSFEQGSDKDDPLAQSIEQPSHTVTLAAPFAIGQFEVTMAQWDVCAAEGACTTRPPDNGWGRDRHPVIMVSWNDAQQYTDWLSKKTGQAYRLPSESEWEYAARAGRKGDWLGGETAGLCDYANIAGAETQFDWRFTDCGDGHALGTVPVGSFKPNAFKLYDVIGNVAEWTADCMNLSYLDAPTDGSAWGRGICSSHMTRGGAWVTGRRDIRLPSRFDLKNGDRNDFTGFRVVRTVTD